MPIKSHRLPAEELAKNFSDIHPPFLYSEAAITEASRCLNCYDAPCTKLCPTGIDIPKFIRQIASGNIRGSARTIFVSNILGTGCSKVCPVERLCEGVCVHLLQKEKPVPIARLQRFSTETALREKWNLFKSEGSLGTKVAVVGAGPAGLACAHLLAIQGSQVTIYEKEQRPGGLLTHGIAAYKVTPGFCREEVDYLLSIGGIDLQLGKELGRDFMLHDLRNSFDAVFLGLGLGKSRPLGIPGEHLDGVTDAIGFINRIRMGEFNEIPVGDNVVVIGMGMTAIDAATQAKRLGAAEVTLVYRRSENEKPCSDRELNLARLDGCRIQWLASPREILGKDGRVTTLICNRMKLENPGTDGRLIPISTGETFSIETDMIIKATGQMPYSDLIDASNLQNNEGRINTGQGFETNIPGVFAGGDAVNGGREMVHAVQEGKEAAKSILSYLKKKK